MEKEIKMELEPIRINKEGGAVDSVNGQTGDVVLTTSDLENTSDYQTGTEVSSAISTAVGLEATARQNADNGLQGQIDALAASSDVTDIVGTYADLEAYDTSKLKDNDIIKVLQDESQNDETTYYRWSTSTESFTLIGEEGPYYTKAQTNTLLQGKENSITSDNKLSADLVDDTGTTNQFATSSQLTKLDNLVNIESIGSNLSLNSSTGELSATDTTYTAGTNVNISAQNVISATDTTYSDFTGTDGVDAGTAGLVPAPATTDAGKFLKADGTWDTAGGGGIIELTSADYNYPVGSELGIAHWLLEPGVYVTAGASGSDINFYENNSSSGNLKPKTLIIVTRTNENSYSVAMLGRSGGWDICSAQVNNGSAYANKTGEVMIGSIAQSTGTNQRNVMSQNATTSMIYADPSTKKQIRIGNTGSVGDYSVSIGTNANSSSSNYVGINTSQYTTPYWWTGGVYIGEGATSTPGSNLQGQVAIGQYANASGNYSIAIGRSSINLEENAVTIGRGSTARAAGVFGIGCQYGGAYNNTNYRVIEGVHDGQDLHDAATLAQGNTLSDSAPTTSTQGVLGQLWTDTTNMHTYQCTAVSGSTYTWTQRW